MKDLNTVLKEVAVNGNVKFPIKENESILNAPINALSLSVRSSNALQRNGIRTVGDLLYKLELLDKIRGLGVKSKQDVLYGLCAYQYVSLEPKEKQKYLSRLIELNCA